MRMVFVPMRILRRVSSLNCGSHRNCVSRLVMPVTSQPIKTALSKLSDVSPIRRLAGNFKKFKFPHGAQGERGLLLPPTFS